MAHKTAPDSENRYEAALERTAPSSSFSPAGLRRQLEATSLDQTPDETAQSYLRRTATDTEGSRGVESTAEITHFGDTRDLPPDLLETPGADGPRFEVVGEVGEGATSHVYAVRDRSLNRTIAVKFLKQHRSRKRGIARRFIHEARVTAMLEHPNIMPVHDVGLTGDNEVFFAMKNVSGASLGDAIRAARAGETMPREFRTVDGRVRIFLKVCDALAYAHDHGFIHQDVKPDNVMLGEYGEVLLLDWGSALGKDTPVEQGRVLYGTPAYMSPEQARRERADERSDVYCLGATFFHALLLRHPTWSEDPEDFWEKKRAGTIDAVADNERGRAPAALLDIALKAMAPDPVHRYRNVNELAEDLKRYQAGMAVGAHRESPLERFARWYRNNTRVFWTATVGAVAVLCVGGLLMHEKVKEWITWRPFYQESFDAADANRLKRNWQAYRSHDWRATEPEPLTDSGSWQLEDGQLLGVSKGVFSNISFVRPVPGDIRVEWDIIPVHGIVNLNCFIAGKTRKEGYTFHVAGFNRVDRVTMTKGREDQYVDTAALGAAFEEGRTYRFRMEKEGRHVRFFVDGRKLIDYRDATPLHGIGHQTFGFECVERNELAIDNVAVYYHPLPLKVSPLDAADQFYEVGHFRDALARYREISILYPDHEIAQTATYRAADCLTQLDSVQQALALFERFHEDNPQHELVALSLHARSLLYRRSGHTHAADSLLGVLGERYPGHAVLRSVFNDMTRERTTALAAIDECWVEDSTDDGSNAQWILDQSRILRDWGKRFGIALSGNVFLSQAAGLLWSTNTLTFDELVRHYPDQRDKQAEALFRDKEYERVLNEFLDQRIWCAEALVEMGHYRRVLREYPRERGSVARALVELGRFEDVVSRYPEQRDQLTDALWGLGRHWEAAQHVSWRAHTYTGFIRRPGLTEEFIHGLRGRRSIGRAMIDIAIRPDTALALLTQIPRHQRTVWCWLSFASAMLEQNRPRDALRRLGGIAHMEQTCAKILIDIGENAIVHRRYPNLRPERAVAYFQEKQFDSAYAIAENHGRERMIIDWARGRGQWLYDTYPRRPRLRADALIVMGRYDRVLTECPDQRDACARALCILGRYGDVLEQYPDRRDECIRALMRLGRPGEAIRRYAESRPEYAQFLVDQGRFDDVVTRFPDQPFQYAQALLALGRAGEIPWGRGAIRLSRGEKLELDGIEAVRAAEAGKADEAVRLLDHDGFYRRRHGARRFVLHLLKPILLGLAGHTEAMRRACRAATVAAERNYAGRLQFELALLLDSIDAHRFLLQPYRLFAETRLEFVTAVKQDIAGKRHEALKAYRELFADPRYRESDMLLPENDYDELEPLFESPSLHRFVRWRLAALRESVAVEQPADKPTESG